MLAAVVSANSYVPGLVDSEGSVFLASSIPFDPYNFLFHGIDSLSFEGLDRDLQFRHSLPMSVGLCFCSHLLLKEASLVMTG